MKAWITFGGAMPVLAPSGYLARIGEDCNGCGGCVSACHFRAINMDGAGQAAFVDSETCMGCGVCEGICPSGAIALVREATKGEPLDLAELLNV